MILINKLDEWYDAIEKVIKYAHTNLPSSNKGITYIDKYAKALNIDKKDITLRFL